MKSVCFAVLLVISFAVFANADEDNDNWPCYLKKCSRNDPNLSKCMVNHANRALKDIFPGDNKIGIPSFLPLVPGDLLFGTKQTFKIQMSDVKIFGAPNLHVTSMDWNFDKKTVDIHLNFHTTITIDANYKSSGTFKGQDVTGFGHLDFVFVGGSLGGNKTYSMKYDTIKVLGRDYAQIKDSVCTYQDGLRIEFQNYALTKEEGERHRKYLNDHSDEFDDALRPEVNGLLCAVINAVFNPILFNFPMDLMFDSS